MPRKLFQVIASTLSAQETCRKTGKADRDMLDTLSRLLPSGGGIDSGTKIGVDSKPDRLVLHCAFHHMNESGFYDGWTNHTIIVVPSLASDFDLRITGRDRNQIKDYLAEVIDAALRQEIELDYENATYRLVA